MKHSFKTNSVTQSVSTGAGGQSELKTDLIKSPLTSEGVLLIFGLSSPTKSDISHGDGYRSCAMGSPGSTSLMISDVNTSAVR